MAMAPETGGDTEDRRRLDDFRPDVAPRPHWMGGRLEPSDGNRTDIPWDTQSREQVDPRTNLGVLAEVCAEHARRQRVDQSCGLCRD
jgi:hypothetical protein